MSIQEAVNEWISIGGRVYNAFSLKHIVYTLYQDLYLEEEEYLDYHFWLDCFIHNGAMPGFMRFRVPGGTNEVLFLQGLEICWDIYWNERQNYRVNDMDEGAEPQHEEEMITNSEGEHIMAVAYWVRDIFNQDIGTFTAEDIPVAEILEQPEIIEMEFTSWD